MVGSDCRENKQNFPMICHPIFRCTSALERWHLRSKGAGKTTIHFTASNDNVQLLLKMVISVNQVSLYGGAADLIQELPDDRRTPGKPVALDQMEQEILTQIPCRSTSPWRVTVKLIAKITSEDLKKLPQDQKLSKLCSEACLKLAERMERRINLYAENTRYLEMKGNLCKRVDRKRCTIRPCLGHKSLQDTRKIQRWSYSSIFIRRSNHLLDWNCERCWKVRQRGNADPSRRKSFEETRCKGKTNIETVVNKQLELHSDGTERMDRHRSAKIRGPLLLPDVKIHYSFTSTQGSWSRRRCRSSSFSTCCKMQVSSIGGFKILVRRNKRKMSTAPYWSANTWIDVLSKGGGQKKRFQYCLEPKFQEKLVYFLALQGHSGKAYSGNARINPALQDNVLFPKDFTKCVLSRRKRKGIEINSAWRSGTRRIQHKNRQTCRILYRCEPDGQWTGLKGNLLRFIESKNRAFQKYLETTSGYGILVQFIARSRRRTVTLPNKFQCGRPLWHTACRVHWESDMHENSRTALPKRKRRTTCCSESKFAMWITRSTQARSKIILGNTKRCTELPGNRVQHCGLQSSKLFPLNSSKAGRTKTTYSCQVDREVRTTSAQRTIS